MLVLPLSFLSLGKSSDQVSSQTTESCLFLVYLFFQHLPRTSLKQLNNGGHCPTFSRVTLVMMVSALIMLTIPTFVPLPLTAGPLSLETWSPLPRLLPSLSTYTCIQPHPARSIPHHAAHGQGHLTSPLWLDTMRTSRLATVSKSLRLNQFEDKVVSNCGASRLARARSQP